MDITLRALLWIMISFMGFAIIVLTFLAGTGIAPSYVGQIEETQKMIAETLQFSDAHAGLCWKELGNEYHYIVKFDARAFFPGIEGREKYQLSLVPVIDFRGEKYVGMPVSGDNAIIESGEPNSLGISFDFASRKMPMLFSTGETENKDLSLISVADGQMLATKLFKLRLDLSSGILGSQPCKAKLGIQCPAGFYTAELSLKDESKGCDSQESNDECKKHLSICGTDLEIMLSGFDDAGASCSRRKARLLVEAGREKTL